MTSRADDGELRPTVFISYSREDANWVKRFKVMLQPVVDNLRLELWVDDQIAPGDRWRSELEAVTARSHIALLLVTPEFLSSRFIKDTELPALVATGARLVPVLVRPCLWQHVPMLTDIQWANDPDRDGALASAKGTSRDELIVKVCRRLVELLPPTATPFRKPDTPDTSHRAGAGDEDPPSVLVRVDSRGRVDGVPPLPRFHARRPEHARLLAALLDPGSGAVGVTGAVSGVGVAGQGGIGKTVLAASLAMDPETASFFPDGIFWVSMGERVDPVAAQRDLLLRLGATAPEVRTLEDGTQALRAILADRRCLLVVDDVWTAAAAAAFRVTGPRGRVLFTGRDPEVLTAAGARINEVQVLSVSAARMLLGDLTDTPVDGLPPDAKRVLNATGRIPLALTLVGATIRAGVSWSQVTAALHGGAETFRGHPYATTFGALQAATETLPADLADAYYSLAVYPSDTSIPVLAVTRYWTQLQGRPSSGVLRELHNRGLLILANDEVRFHDLQHDYLLLRAEDITQLHERLLDSYRELLPGRHHPWFTLPPDEPYIWEHLRHHLIGAGRWRELRSTMTDPGYIAARVHAAGPYAVDADLVAAATALSDDQSLAWLRDRLAQSAHLLTGLPTLSDVAATLASRLPDVPVDVDRASLDELLRPPYLTPVWGLTVASGWRRVLTGHTGSVEAVAVAAQGELLASGGSDGSLRLWDPVSGRLVREWTGHPAEVCAVTFTARMELLASGGGDGAVRLWDPASGRLVREWTGHPGGVWAMSYSARTKQLASGGVDGSVRVWNLSNGRLIRELIRRRESVWAVAFAPDADLVVSGGDNGSIRVWNPSNGRLIREWTGHPGVVRAVAFAPDGRLLASAGDDGSMRLWDPSSGHHLRQLTGPGRWVRALAFTPNGQRLASGDVDGTVRVWDPNDGRLVREITAHYGGVRAVTFTPDGQLLASGGDDGSVRLWNSASGPDLTRTTDPGKLLVVAGTSDGRWLASGGDDGFVRLWDPGSGRPVREWTAHRRGVRAAAFSPDGRWLASGGDDGFVRLWDPGSGRLVREFTAHPRGVWATAFASDGRYLVSSGGDGSMRLWDPGSGLPVQEWTAHARGGWATACASDGRSLASGGYDGTVRLWDPSSGKLVWEWTGHTGRVRGVAFAPDGSLLASAGADGSVRLWDPATGKAAAAIGTDVPATSITWSPSGIIVCGENRIFLLRTVTTRSEPDSGGEND